MKILNKNTVRLLKLFYQNPQREFYIQEIGRKLGKKPGVFQRALNDLQKDGLLVSEYKANARFFRINKNYFIYNELKSIIEKSAKACLVGFILLLCSSFSLAEETLNLSRAIEIAYENNRDLQMQQKQVDAARANIVSSAGVFYPQLNLKASYTRNDSVFFPSIYTGYTDDHLASLNLSQSVYNGGVNIANFKQALLSWDTEKETLRAKKLDIEFEAKRLFYGLLFAYETQRIAQETFDKARAHYENVKEMYKQGTASKFDVLQSGVQVSLLEPDVVKASNDIESMKADLNKLLGQKIDSPVTANEKLAYEAISIDEKEFLKEAYLGRPEMRLKSLGIDIDKWGIHMAKSGYRPSVDILAGYSFRSNSLANLISQKQNNWNAGISVNIPIFEGFTTKGKVDAAKAKYAQAKIDKENLAEQIAVDIRKACLDLNESQAIIKSQKDNIGQAKEALRIAEVSFTNGVAINLDVLDAQVSLSQIQRNLASAIYDYLMAHAFLDRSMGKATISDGEKNEKKN